MRRSDESPDLAAAAGVDGCVDVHKNHLSVVHQWTDKRHTSRPQSYVIHIPLHQQSTHSQHVGRLTSRRQHLQLHTPQYWPLTTMLTTDHLYRPLTTILTTILTDHNSDHGRKRPHTSAAHVASTERQHIRGSLRGQSVSSWICPRPKAESIPSFRSANDGKICQFLVLL